MIKTQSKKLTKDYNLFQLAVPHYNEMQSFVSKIIKENLSLQKIKNQKYQVLEIGVGFGDTSLEVLKANKNIFLTGLDIEAKAIKESKEILKKYSNRIKILKKDCFKFLKLSKNESFHGVVSAFTIHNFNSKQRQILHKEIYRVLKPNGFFINLDKIALNNLKMHQKSLNKQISDFGVFDSINRNDLKREWTKHYLKDDKVKFTEKEVDTLIKNYFKIKPMFVYRKGMEAIIKICK